MSKSRFLTREQILAGDNRPEKIKALDGRRGRRPKWTGADIGAEEAVAIEVELLRRKERIPVSKDRTPARIFEEAGRLHNESVRSAARFYAKYRDDARAWAKLIVEIIPEHQRRLAELKRLYGDGIGRLPCTSCDWISVRRETLMPSEIPGFDEAVRLFIGEN